MTGDRGTEEFTGDQTRSSRPLWCISLERVVCRGVNEAFEIVPNWVVPPTFSPVSGAAQPDFVAAEFGSLRFFGLML